MKTNIVYKICKYDFYYYYSINTDILRLKYELMKKTVAPEGTKLLCFVSLQKTREFFDYRCNLVIFKGTAEGLCRVPPFRYMDVYKYGDNFLINKWNILSSFTTHRLDLLDTETISDMGLLYWPRGTVGCESFTPLEIVDI